MNYTDYTDNIGKYVAFDGPEGGSCWAKICGVAKTSSVMEDEVDNYVVEERKWRQGNKIGSVRGKTLLRCDFIKKNHIIGLDQLENLSEEEIDRLFIAVLGSNENTALELGADKIMKVLREKR
jgi:hypothetical protein